MGIYVYKTLSKHVKTEMGNVHEAKYVTKVGCREVYGRSGLTGEHLYAYGLDPLEPVYLHPGSGSGFWYDDNGHKLVGWLRKNGRSWYISLVEPTKGEEIAKELEEGHVSHEASGSYEFKTEVNSMGCAITMLINAGDTSGTRSITYRSVYPYKIGEFLDATLKKARNPIHGSISMNESIINAAVA